MISTAKEKVQCGHKPLSQLRRTDEQVSHHCTQDVLPVLPHPHRLRENEIRLGVDMFLKEDYQSLYHALCDYQNVKYIGLWTESETPCLRKTSFLLSGLTL
jgi:hypothetical protein